MRHRDTRIRGDVASVELAQVRNVKATRLDSSAARKVGNQNIIAAILLVSIGLAAYLFFVYVLD